MDWLYYLAGAAIVPILVALYLYGGLFKRDSRRDEEINRLIDERIERMNLSRKKDD